MTIVSNDPIWWPLISYARQSDYFAAASFIVVLYDWALTFGQEFELIWRQRWSLMTVLYLTVRYAGIPYSFLTVFSILSPASVTDARCNIIYYVTSWISIIVNAMLGVIIIARLQAMYQRSQKMLIFLVVFFLTVQIACVVLSVMQTTGGQSSAVEFVLSGARLCGYEMEGDAQFLITMTWILGVMWEALTLFLAVWITVKHFRELPRPTRWANGDLFTILMKTHLYFASFSFIYFFQIITSYTPSESSTADEFDDFLQITLVVQMFVLGPRLILGVREYHAQLVAHSNDGTGMSSIVFQERIQITTDSDV